MHSQLTINGSFGDIVKFQDHYIEKNIRTLEIKNFKIM